MTSNFRPFLASPRLLSLQVWRFQILVLNFLLKERLLKSKKYLPHLMIMLSSDATLYLYSSLDSQPVETDIKYDLEVEVSSIARKQEDTSDHDEPDAYANGPLAHENWLAQYEAEDKRNKNLIGLLLQ